MAFTLSSRDWAIEKLNTHDNVLVLRPLGEIFISIERKKYAPFSTAIISEQVVHPRAIQQIISLGVESHFIANIPKSGIWTGDAIFATNVQNLGWGGFGELMSAINNEEVTTFQKKEYSFVERGIRQHNRVCNYERIFDRVYCISRRNLPSISVAFIYEYEFTAEHVRTARDRYGEFSVIVKTNPNGTITQLANDVAKGLGIEIFAWGEFLSRLNRR